MKAKDAPPPTAIILAGICVAPTSASFCPIPIEGMKTEVGLPTVIMMVAGGVEYPIFDRI